MAERKFNDIKALRERRNELIVLMNKSKVGSDEYADAKQGIEDIDELLKNAGDISNEKSKTFWNALKVGGMLLLTGAGLVWAHHDDKSDSIPGKFLSKFVEGLIWKKL